MEIQWSGGINITARERRAKGEILDSLVYSQLAEGINDNSLAGYPCSEAHGRRRSIRGLDGSKSEGQHQGPKFCKTLINWDLE